MHGSGPNTSTPTIWLGLLDRIACAWPKLGFRVALVRLTMGTGGHLFLNISVAGGPIIPINDSGSIGVLYSQVSSQLVINIGM